MPETTSLAHTQFIVTKLLCPSWICEVSLRNEWPEIFFDHPTDGQYEACLWIDGDWEIAPTPALPQGLSERQQQMIWLGELANQEVKVATCKPDGGLDIEFKSGLHLLISGASSDPTVDEPWILSEPGHQDGAKVVALRMTGFAAWPGKWIEPFPPDMAASETDGA